MSDKIYVSGHQNPDTDSVLSAMVWANYLNFQWKDAQAIKLGEMNNETEYVLNQIDMAPPQTVKNLDKDSRIFLVDHNDSSQSVPNRQDLEIVGLIDHHNIGDFSTDSPLYMRVDNVGSTCSILYQIFENSDYQVNKDQAIMMMAGIVSDTLLFRSPTCTDEDKRIVQELANIADIDYESFAQDMFAAKSDLGDISAEKIVRSDYKNYSMGESKIGIGVLETTDPSYGLNRKDEILEAMEKVKKDDGLDFLMFSIIDILEETNQTFVLGQKEADIINEVFDKQSSSGDTIDMEDRVSRKRQLVPHLNKYFA